MKRNLLPLVIGAALIGFVSLANLVRLIWDIPAHIGAITLPGWSGGIAFVVLGLLSIWMFRAIRNQR